MRSSGGKRNKILIVLYYYYPYVSGVSVYAKRLAEGLVKSGYEVTILTSRFDDKSPKQETINGVRVVRRPVMLKLGKGVIMPTFWLDIIRFARSHDYVNCHLPMADSGVSSLFVPKKKLVTTYHCDIFLGKGLADRLITAVSMALMRVQLSRSRAVICLSHDYLSHSKMKRYMPKATPVFPIIAAEDFVPVDSRPLFRKLKIKDSTIKIGFVGRVVYEKGINYLLESIPYLEKKLNDFKIIIVGDYKNVAGGSIKDQLDSYIEKYPDRILFTGYLSDEERGQFYSGINVFLLPSMDPLEAFGIVQVEALLCGAPVVASNLPGVRQVAKLTGYGRISQLRDPQDIAKQIIEVVTHPKQYAPNRSKVAKIFDPQKTIDSYSELMPLVQWNNK